MSTEVPRRRPVGPSEAKDALWRYCAQKVAQGVCRKRGGYHAANGAYHRGGPCPAPLIEDRLLDALDNGPLFSLEILINKTDYDELAWIEMHTPQGVLYRL